MTRLPPQTELKNQRLSKQDSDDERPTATVIKKENKENKAPLVNQVPTCNEQFVQSCIDQLIGVFPETKLKSKKAEKLIDLITSHYSS